MDFVVGHPRSGTQFVAHLLCTADKDAARWECMTLGERTEGIDGPYVSLARCNHALITGCTDYYEGRLGAAEVRDMLRHPRHKVECNWKLTWILPPLLEEFPEAKLVHLTRDPRKNVLSCYNLEWYGRSMHTTEPILPNHYRLFFASIPYIKRDDWRFLNPFERNCAMWVETHRLILEQADRSQGYLLVRQEELRQAEVTAKLFRFLDLPLPSQEALDKVHATPVNKKEGELELVARYAPPMDEYPRWPPQFLESFKRICGPMAEQLGYAV